MSRPATDLQITADAPALLEAAADNHPARALYDALGGGIAEHGPTVNYWFLLDRAGE